MTLASHGAYEDTGVWRPAYSPEWVTAQDQIAAWCEAAGLATYRDAVGNVWGRLEGTEPGKVIATGSHIDTQLPGGRYDGALGVLSGLLALRALKEQFGTPKRTLEMVSLCLEETSGRFPTSQMWGSRAIAGAIAPEDPGNVFDYDGISIADAMLSVGLDPEKVAEATRDDIDVFVELHIEQGPLLEEQGIPVAVVKRITGIRTYRITLRGRADHAGGRPMDMRRDAMGGAAEIITGVLNNAYRMGRPAVTTVGRIHAEPNLPSIVPQEVRFTVNARHPDPVAGKILYARHEDLIKDVAARHDLDLVWEIGGEGKPSVLDAELVQLFRDVARDLNIPATTMDSAGGHDSGRMSQIARTVMLFVPSKNGRSHTPDEFTAIKDIVPGIEVLAAGLHRLAY